MRNFVQEGRVITCTAPAGGVVSGNGYKIGEMFGVAAVTAAEGQSFELAVAHVFCLPKAAVTIGECVKVYWDAAAGKVTTSSVGNTYIGYSVGSRQSGDTMVNVLLKN